MRERRKEICDATKKVTYESRKRALNALNTERALSVDGQRNNREGVPCAVYKCPHCRDWHLTSQAQR